MSLQTTAKNATSTAHILREDIGDFVRGRARRFAPQLDDRQRRVFADLRRDGFAVVEGYWSREQALAVRDRLEASMEVGVDTEFEGGAYLRVWDSRAHDQGVRRIYHVDRLMPELEEFRHDPFTRDLAAAYYRMPFHSGALVFQHNTRSNENTRYYHVDAFSRELKAFMYLDDVDEGNGPFTYLRGTHRSHLTRLRKQLVGNKEGSPTSFYAEDLGRFLDREVQICGRAGTLIVTDVRGFHRGSPQADRSRSVLVNYIIKSEGDLALDR